MIQRLKFILLLALVPSISSGQSTFFKTNGTAIRGYDPVAYFVKREAVKGSDQYTLNWQGAEWQFSTKDNLEAFKLTPEKFAPQYGGYCAYGVSENHKSPTDPNAFTIIDDKLYLNYNMNVKQTWSKDTKAYIEKAENNWPKLQAQQD